MAREEFDETVFPEHGLTAMNSDEAIGSEGKGIAVPIC